MPHKLRNLLTEYAIETADAMGWADLTNGELLAAVEVAGFDVMLTGDKNLSYQQNLKHRRLAIVVLGTNDGNVLRNNSSPIAEQLQRAAPGTSQTVSLERLQRTPK